jgi:hypothetical protein
MSALPKTVLPIPENAFFEQAVFDQDLSQGLLELARLSPELLDLVRVASRAVSPASRFLPASRNSFDQR